MRAMQRKTGLSAMIETPPRPAIGVVAALAVVAQGPLVNIVLHMACPAGCIHLREIVIGVT